MYGISTHEKKSAYINPILAQVKKVTLFALWPQNFKSMILKNFYKNAFYFGDLMNRHEFFEPYVIFSFCDILFQ